MKASLAHEAPAHSPFGGSVATRVLRCPASVGLVEKVPVHLRRSSAYAERGTALHSAVALLFDDNGPSLESLVGRTIGDYAITNGDVENSLRPVFTHITALLDAPGTEFYLERRVGFPTIPGAYGTADLLIRIGNTIHVVDLKFGAGVRVTALTPDGDEDVINAQLLFYAAAARHSLREFFAGVETVVLTILQPMSIEADAEMVSSVEVGHAELDGFIAIYRAACEEALSEFPRLARAIGAAFARQDRFARRIPVRFSISPSSWRRRLQAPTFPYWPRRRRRRHTCSCLLVRSENARAPVPGRGEIVRSFSRALEAFREGGGD